MGNIVPVSADRGAEDIELLKIARRKLSCHSVYKQPTPRCRCQQVPESSGALSFTGGARLTTNRRSGTDGVLFHVPVNYERTDLNDLRLVRPAIVKPLHRTPLIEP